MPERLIREIIVVPERVHKGDLVLNLSKGVTEPEKTLKQYVVTPQLVSCFEDALGFVRSAVEAANSMACYLHGSFGTGKSHFMAVLDLLLANNSVVRSIPELAKVCDNHRWIETKRFLLVPYHMIGARSMESAILGGYVALSSRLTQIVEAAYAIRSEPTPGSLDTSYDMSESHFQSLYPSLILQRPVGANLGEALEHLLDQALSHQFPKHPKFGQEIKVGKDLRQVLDICAEAARTTDGRVFVEDKGVRQKLRNICNPLDLGTMSETHFVLGTFWKNQFNRLLSASGQPHPTVADLRRWIDNPDERGLPREIQNLLVLVYADQTNRSFIRYGGNYPPTLDDMPPELELVEQQLPDVKDWERAILLVGDVFGDAISPLLNASNLANLASKVAAGVGTFKVDCDSLPDRLQLVLKNLSVPDAETGKADRVRTAKSVKSFLKCCEGEEPTALVGAIASVKAETSGTAMGRSLKTAKPILDCLRATRWELFEAVSHVQDARKTEADLLLADVRSWLKTDEYALAGGLASKLSDAESRAIRLLTPPKPTPEPEKKPEQTPISAPTGTKWKQVGTGSKTRLTKADLSATVQELHQKLEDNPRYRLSIQWTLEEESQ